MLNKDHVLEIVKRKGPLIPVQVATELKISILMSSALLAELASENKVNISILKIGGSPLYYVKGQEYKLQQYSNKLHEKEKKSYELLREKRILRDNLLEPIYRVTLRQIKDFAVPLNVNYNGLTEIFWKWYLLPDNEAESLIRAELDISQRTGKEVTEPKHYEEKEKEAIKEEIKEEKPADKKIVKKDNSFLIKKVLVFFERNNIKVIQQNIIKKNKEIDFLVELPSAVGSLAYYCKAKNKKRVTEGDLSTTFIQAQSKKLPVLFLTTGDVAKRAEEMLSKEFKGMQVKRI